MNDDTHNQTTADLYVQAAYFNMILKLGDSGLSADTHAFRFPALSECLPIDEKSWAVVAAEQKPLVAKELIVACKRRGWNASLTLDGEGSRWDKRTIRMHGIMVEVDYSNYWFPDSDPYVCQVLVDINLDLCMLNPDYVYEE